MEKRKPYAKIVTPASYPGFWKYRLDTISQFLSKKGTCCSSSIEKSTREARIRFEVRSTLLVRLPVSAWGVPQNRFKTGLKPVRAILLYVVGKTGFLGKKPVFKKIEKQHFEEHKISILLVKTVWKDLSDWQRSILSKLEKSVSGKTICSDHKKPQKRRSEP